MVLKKGRRFVLLGFALLAVVSIVMFGVVSTYIAAKSDEAISEVGEVYTNAMAEQVVKRNYRENASGGCRIWRGYVERAFRERLGS